MPHPYCAPAERLAALLLSLVRAVDSRRLTGRLATPLFILIFNRIRGIKQIFGRLAVRIAAGRFSARCASKRPPAEQPHAKPPSRAKNPLPRGVAWLIKLVPEAAAHASRLRSLLADPEMLALLAAAPAPMRRPLRSLCRMLGLPPPPILALPPRPRPPPAPPAAKREKPPPLARSRLGFHKGLPPLFPFTPRFGGKPPAKKPA